jgi:anti-sigma regulatory factor (Ser/Thr protein kinase)
VSLGTSKRTTPARLTGGVPGGAVNIETQLAPDPISARAARQLIEAALERWGDDDSTEVATLLTTELVTNAIVHAQTDFALRVTTHQDRLRVEVSDSSHDPPRLIPIQNAEEHGRGLHLVHALSASWGVEWTADGKAVWFELAEDPR